LVLFSIFVVSQTSGPHLRGLLEIFPLSIDQYERMIAEGILGEDDAIELLEGPLVAIDRGASDREYKGELYAVAGILLY